MQDSEDAYLAVFNARLLWVRFVERNRNDVVRLLARSGAPAWQGLDSQAAPMHACPSGVSATEAAGAFLTGPCLRSSLTWQSYCGRCNSLHSVVWTGALTLGIARRKDRAEQLCSFFFL